MIEIDNEPVFFALDAAKVIDGHRIQPGTEAVALATNGISKTVVRLASGVEITADPRDLRHDDHPGEA